MSALRAFLGLATGGRGIVVMLGLGAAAFAAGIWLGIETQKSWQARADIKVERKQARSAARETERRAQIATTFERTRDSIEQQNRRLDHELQAYVDSRPDLWDCDIGIDGVRLIVGWDQAGLGGNATEPPVPVPAAAAASGEQSGAGPAGEHEAAHRDLLRVREPTSGAR